MLIEILYANIVNITNNICMLILFIKITINKNTYILNNNIYIYSQNTNNMNNQQLTSIDISLINKM